MSVGSLQTTVITFTVRSPLNFMIDGDCDYWSGVEWSWSWSVTHRAPRVAEQGRPAGMRDFRERKGLALDKTDSDREGRARDVPAWTGLQQAINMQAINDQVAP